MKGRAIYGGYDATRGIISLNIGAVAPDEVQKWAEQKYLDVEIDVPGKKRSLNANAYLWKLCELLAEKLRTSKDEVYEGLLQKYGYLSDITITVKSEVDMSKIDGHWKFHKESKDGKFKAYWMIRGTSEYTSKEFAYFLDMAIEEAKEQGIETLPEEELKRMYEQLEARNGKTN